MVHAPMFAPLNRLRSSVLNNADGILMATPRSFESPDAMAHIIDWFEGGSKEVHLVGPMLSPQKATVAASDKATDFNEFMTRMLESHGPNSMLYVSQSSRLLYGDNDPDFTSQISFGSVFWPSDPQTVYTFLDALLERNVPFV